MPSPTTNVLCLVFMIGRGLVLPQTYQIYMLFAKMKCDFVKIKIRNDFMPDFLIKTAIHHHHSNYPYFYRDLIYPPPIF